jgi:hypothetical protein
VRSVVVSLGDVVVGPYRMDLDRSDSMIHISLFPSDLVKHWSRCGLTADFAASFFSFRFPDSKKARNSLSVIMNEIVENAVKFSNTPNANIAINLFNMTDLIVFEVENFTNQEQFESFRATARDLLESSDIEERYFEVLSSKAANSMTSGLGLLTIIHDFNARIGVRFTETDTDTRRVSLQVIVRPEELME